MALTKRQKQYAIKDTKLHGSDTGSPEAQISLLTKRIKELTKHLQKNKKDTHSRRGLLQLVAKRRSHIQYLKNTSLKRYNDLAKKLGLKKAE